MFLSKPVNVYGIKEMGGGEKNHNTFVPANRNDSVFSEYAPYLKFVHAIYINGCFTSKFWRNTFTL